MREAVRYPARVTLRTLSAITVALAATLLVGGPPVTAASKSKPKEVQPPVFVPDLDRQGLPEGATLDGPTWTWSRPTYRVRLRKLEVEERQAYIRNHTGSPSDPFARQHGQSKGFLTFLLLIENLDSDYLIFQPQNSWLRSKHNKIEYPLDEGTIRSIYDLLEQEFPPAYEKAVRALLDGEKMFYRGEQVHGLLVYRLPDERVRQFTVDVKVTLDDGQAEEFTASYRALKKGEQQP